MVTTSFHTHCVIDYCAAAGNTTMARPRIISSFNVDASFRQIPALHCVNDITRRDKQRQASSKLEVNKL